MARLTAADIYGIWAGAVMAWDDQDTFDEDTYTENINRIISAGVCGVYTTGSTGEFYALEYEEFCTMVDIQAEACGKAGMKLQIGCCSDATRKTIKLLEYAASKPQVGAAQVNIPYWMELNDRELLGFFKDLYNACPDMPLVHYNIPRAKRFLTGQDYLRILDVAPSLVGVKYTFAGSHFGQLQDAMRLTPQLSYFVAEMFLVSAMQLGARGCYSALVSTNPSLMLDMYNKAAKGEWDKAIAMQQHVAKFYADAVPFIQARGEGCIDPVFDKGLAVASGCALGHHRCRAPYIGWSDETVVAMRDWLKANYPEILYPNQ